MSYIWGMTVRRGVCAGGLEDAPELAGNRRVRGDTLAVPLDGGLLETVEFTDQVVPIERHAGNPTETNQFHL